MKEFEKHSENLFKDYAKFVAISQRIDGQRWNQIKNENKLRNMQGCEKYYLGKKWRIL